MLGNGLKPVHILLVLIVVVLLFGAKRLPDLAKSVGQSLKIFKNEIKELKDDEPAAPVTPSAAPTAPAATPPTTAPPVAGPGTTVPPATDPRV